MKRYSYKAASSSARAMLDEPSIEEESLPDLAQKRMPPWLVSMIVHLVVLILLVLIPLKDELISGISLTGIFGQQESDESFDVTSEELDDSSLGTIDDPLTEDPSMSASLVGVLSLDPPDSTPSPTEFTSTSLMNGLSGRTGSMKESLLRAFGGTAATEDAVRLGLQWIVKQQRSDGSWSLRGPYSKGGVNENKSAATAMALLALVGAGHTHRSGEHQPAVEKGLYYLLQLQDSDGFFSSAAPERQQMYAQAQCTIVVCELYGMTKDDSLRGVAQKAIDFAESAQGETGGWRYYPGDDGDTSVTGWYVMAMMSAQMAGLRTSSQCLEKVSHFLDLVQHQDGALYSYLEYDASSLSMTAEGLLCRQYLGWKQSDPRMLKGADYLLSRLVDADDPDKSFYYWYYATQMLHHLGGTQWDRWNGAMREVLPKMQIRSGNEIGSWAPEGEQWSVSGGRLYSTCFCIYCLEVYYRHLPLYDFK